MRLSDYTGIINSIFGIACIYLWCVAGAAAETTQSISPQFISGAEWDLLVSYRDYSGQRIESKTVFTYRVDSVRNEDNHWSMSIFSKTDPDHVMQLSGAISPFSVDEVDGASNVNAVVMPMITQKTFFPLDVPCFPLIPDQEDIYKIIYRMNDDLFFSKQFVLSSSQVDTAQLPKNEMAISGSALIEVRYKEFGLDATTISSGFLQYWTPEYPWAVYGENPMMVYWMVRYESNK